MSVKAKSQSQSSVFDSIKLIIAILLIVAAIGGFYYFSEESLLYRVLGMLAVVLAAVGISFTTATGKKFLGFMRNSRIEVRKMVWPTRVETMQTTLMVIVIVLLIAIFLWLVDMLLGWGVSSLLK